MAFRGSSHGFPPFFPAFPEPKGSPQDRPVDLSSSEPRHGGFPPPNRLR